MRVSTRNDWLAAGIVLLAIAAVFAIPAATTGASLARAVAAMAIAALVAMVVARAPFTFALRVRTGFVALVALSLWYALSRVWAIEPSGSVYESARVSAFVLLAWAVHTCVVGTAARRALLGGVAVAALVVCAPPLLDALRDGAPTERVPGELGYWNATAIVALVLVPVAVALAGTGRRALIALGAALIPIAGVTAVATASRGALAALALALLVQALLDPDYRGGLPRALVAAGTLGLVIVGLAIDDMSVPVVLVGPALVAAGGFGLIRARRVRRERARLAVVDAPAEPDEPAEAPRRRIVLRLGVQAVGALFVVVLAGLLVALVLDANDGATPTVGGAPETGDVTRLTSTDDSARLAWWKDGIEFWRESPIIGRGGGAFGALHVVGRNTNLEHVHSMPLEVLLETGIIGFTMLAVAAIMLLRVLRRGRRSTERALAGAIAVMILAQGSIDWTLSLPQVAVLLAIAGPIALVRPPDPDDETAPTAPQHVPTWAAVTMLVSLAVATTVALTPVLASLLADQGSRAFDEGEPRRAAELFDQSLLLVPELDTLALQVLSLRAAGDDEAARDLLRDNDAVWLHRLDGLLLAQPLLADDPELGDEIARRIDELQTRQDAATPGLA